jgi:AcrR family transcriptional regulator
MAKSPPTPERILEAALGLAEEEGWGSLRLRRVAERLGIAPAAVRRHFRDKDALADAWLASADAAMLARRSRAFARRPPSERLHRVICDWLDALAPHRRVTGEMLAEKLYPGHPHHNIGLVLALSRTVQWIRDAAGLDADGRRRQVEEIGLSLLFAATVVRWLEDESPGQERTRATLADRLAVADRALACLRRSQSPARRP